KIAAVAPCTAVHELHQAGSVGSRLGAENAVGCPAARRIRIDSLSLQAQRPRLPMLADEVLLRRLMERNDALYRVVEQVHQGGKRVAEEPADAQRHIDPRTGKLGQGNDFDAAGSAGLL